MFKKYENTEYQNQEIIARYNELVDKYDQAMELEHTSVSSDIRQAIMLTIHALLDTDDTFKQLIYTLNGFKPLR